MKDQTIRTLNRINIRFYETVADSWQSSRNYAWPSWESFLDSSRFFSSSPLALSVLDVGCGQGRFAEFLSAKTIGLRYTGVDRSDILLAAAVSRFPNYTWRNIDIVEQLLANLPVAVGNYQIVSLFGVLHHIPSYTLRRQLLSDIWSRVAPQGELWITYWALTPEQRKKKERILQEVADTWAISLEELEPGDSFFGWKDSFAVRYLHWIGQEEEQNLLDALPNALIVQAWDERRQGERGNRCLLLRKLQ